MPPIIGIQFSPTGKQYHFDAKGLTDLESGDRVVVKTTRGRQLGIVTGYVPAEKLEGRSCKPIERRATPRDLVMQQQWDAKALSALVTCKAEVEKLGLKGYKFVKAEYNFDGSQVTILYTTEKKRAELGALKRVLRRVLRTQVEHFQAGPRDLAKILDGLGACGEPRCCSRFKTRFSSVSIRMAKVQNISLTPSEITGVCGRLRCGLAYEYQQYSDAAVGLPRRGKMIVTPHGKGRVVEIRTLAGEIVVDVEGARHVIQREDIGKTEFTNPPDEAPLLELPSWLPEERPVKEKPQERQAQAKGRRSRQSRRRGSEQRPAAKPGEAKSQAAAPKPAGQASRKKKSSHRRRGRPRRRTGRPDKKE